MANHSFQVFIDESGDEGFVFHPDGRGSSRWLILSAVVVRKENSLRIVRLMEAVRKTLGREPKTALHFCKLNHAQRIPYLRAISAEPLRTVSVLVCKPAIHEPEKFQREKHRLYRYATRLLLERVSWLCRDHRKQDIGDGRAEIIFSNRSQMSYDDLREYVALLRENADPSKVTIDWSVVDPMEIRAVEHSQLAGLQVADAVASSLYQAVNPNQFGDIEVRYASLLTRNFYRYRSGALTGYGLKFWPEDLSNLKRENPHLAGLAELLGD